ncbi:MAG: transposase [Erysipelothrix sp.]|nr:transposase [Erysipelothrix sp.]
MLYQNKFETLEQLQRELGEYIWWYNNERLHSSLGYKSPVSYAQL